ncbi:MAG: hypothetical protein JWR09_350 [Mucilaginibacter sp.]|nr:hypothetical protein [Mucilaginibacter sp.]
MKLFNPLTFICILVLSLIITFSFKKNSADKTTLINEDATIINTGSTAADGCGWQIKTAGTDSIYSPLDLNEQYQVNNLKIHVSYHKLKTRFYCSQVANDPGPGIAEVSIDSIKPR